MQRGIRIGLIVFVVMMLTAAIAYYAFSRSYFLVTVSGESMTPTFQSGDHIIFKKVEEPSAGDYVVFKLPEDWKQAWLGDDSDSLIKRVQLLPGDTLSWDGENWARNGEIFTTVTNGTCEREALEYKLKPNEYFVTGDTTVTQTLDSREAFCRGLDYVVPGDKVENFAQVKRVF